MVPTIKGITEKVTYKHPPSILDATFNLRGGKEGKITSNGFKEKEKDMNRQNRMFIN